MKKLVITLSLFSLMITGCADIFNISSSDLQTGSNGSGSSSGTGGDTGSVVLAENGLFAGSNILDYDKSKQLRTLTYYAGNKYGDYKSKLSYTISSDNNIVAKEQIYNKKSIKKLRAKEQLNEDIKNFQIYAENKGIKPIEKKEGIQFRTAPQTVTVNTKWNNVYVMNRNRTFKTINTTCIAVSNHAYFFLEDRLTKPTDEQIKAITEAFDKDYETIHKYYGEEEDTDGNGKVSFIIADFDEGLFGFFYTADKYLNSQIPAEIKSNESDVLYVNHKFFAADKWKKYATDVKATFIHEFQHMVLFDSRSRMKLSPNIETWINEGLSMLSEYYGNYGAPHYNYIAGYFNINQGKSLITNDSSVDYGLSYLFIRYLQIRFGDEIVKKIYSSKKSGTQMIEDATGMDFDELYLDFTKMVLVTGRGITLDKRYNIEEFNGIEGSETYNRNGFNLANIIDEVISRNSKNQLFLTDFGYRNELSLYGFQITKWSTSPNILNLQSTNIKGMYYSW